MRLLELLWNDLVGLARVMPRRIIGDSLQVGEGYLDVH